MMRGLGWLVPAVLFLAHDRAAAQVTVRTYQEACDGGDLIACNVFGLMYETGDRVPRDAARAATLYQRACEGGELLGCTNLALLHENGTGVPPDVPRALGLYRVACEGGETLACGRLRRLEGASGVRPGELYFKSARVGDAATRQPLGEAIVEILDLGIRMSSDDAGRLPLPPLPSGRYRLRAQRLGYDDLEGEFEVPGNSEVLVLMTRAAIDDLDAPGRVEGRVFEELGDGLTNVEVSVVGQERAPTLTNAMGRFSLRDLQPGLQQIRFVLLGYAPRTVTMIVQPGRTTDVTAIMSPQPFELEPIRVAVRSTYLEGNGFYQRQGFGLGRHFDRAAIAAVDPARLSDLIDRVPMRGPGPSTGRGGRCSDTVFLDGLPTFGVDLDLIDLSQVEAVEVYAGGTDTPIELGVYANGCGVIMIWTRR